MDERIWFYIIAGIIYFLARRKKKKPEQQVQTPDSSNRPQQSRQPVSFEDLLREITEQREQESPRPVPVYQEEEEEDLPIRKMREEREALEREGANRQFADAESLRVYEESIKQAEGFDIAYEPDSHYESQRLFKGKEYGKAEPSLADEIRSGLQDTNTARKAIIYGEILNRKY